MLLLSAVLTSFQCTLITTRQVLFVCCHCLCINCGVDLLSTEHGAVHSQGQYIIPNGIPWQQHLLLMVVSAKLLADTEAALQMQAAGGSAAATGSGGPLVNPSNAAAMHQLLRQPVLPVRYIMTGLTQFNQPLTYQDHGAIMELRQAQQT